MEVQKAVLLVTMSLTAWSVLALLLDRRGHPGIHRGFALLLGCLCLTQAYFYSRLLIPGGVAWLGLPAQATLWLKGPLLWWMVRLAAGQPPARPGRHLLAFLAAVTCLLAWPEASAGVQSLGCLHALAYLLLSLPTLRAARPRLARIWRGHPNTSYYWLLWLVGGLIVLLLADLALSVPVLVTGLLPADAVAWVAWPISAWLLGVAWASLYRPPQFHQRHAPAGPAEATAEAASAPGPEAHAGPVGPVGQPAWRELDESLARNLAAELQRLMDEQQLYRDGELSLPRLAGRLGISVHQTSELLNVHLGIGFYDYLARQRLAYACRLLRDPDCEWRVIDIAFESGFGNKNSFYRQFRETYGVTPAQYRQQHQDRPALA